MRFLFDLLVIMAILLWILGLVAQGALPLHGAALSLVALVFFVAAIRVGGALSRRIRSLFRMALPICALLTFVIFYSGGSLPEMSTPMSSILVLLVMLIGLYCMFRGLFK